MRAYGGCHPRVQSVSPHEDNAGQWQFTAVPTPRTTLAQPGASIGW
jgi:hypothetical protein